MKKIVLLGSLFLLLQSNTADEGMFPLGEISKIDLKAAGLRIPVNEVYNPSGTSLVQALVRVGGCTGSFVSNEGLIVTNHHCAFGAVASASTPENDYLTKGFVAGNRETEIPTALTAKITESYEDVSRRVLKGVDQVDAPELKTQLMESNLKNLVEQEKASHPELLIEVSEMLQGKVYTLFRYRELKDIRLVYVPPRSIGEFGGESDNWVWPRHTGDFSFLRAYVGKDGKAAAFSTENIPYQPKQFLRINASGVKENDFVFILGYPGRTFRNQPSQYLDFQFEHQLPYISEWYDFQIKAMQELGKTDKKRELALASRIKSLANVTKNYKGKIQGFKRTDILQQRKADDAAMQAMIKADPALQAEYGNVFADIDRVYASKMSSARRDLWIQQAMGSSGILFGAGYIAAQQEIYQNGTGKKEDKLKAFTDTKKSFDYGYRIADLELEKIIIRQVLKDGLKLAPEQQPASLKGFASQSNPEAAIDAWVDKAFAKTIYTQSSKVSTFWQKNPEKLLKLKDPLHELAGDLYKLLQKYQTEERQRQNELNTLLPKLTDLRLMYKKSSFIPDANSTLRFTYGYIKGYWPADGEYHRPFTSIKGILEKASRDGDYFLEDFIQQLLNSEDPESIVCFLYNLDTTGGNSGSPIMDADGKLVGVNFDRAYTATINDFAWNEEYSRSIGVDIRYVLLIMKKLSKADHLIREMGVTM